LSVTLDYLSSVEISYIPGRRTPLNPRSLTLVNVELTNKGCPHEFSVGSASIVFPGFQPGFTFAAKSAAVMGLKAPLQMTCAETVDIRAASANLLIDGVISKTLIDFKEVYAVDDGLYM
jgi:hypothetical protein